MKIALTANAAWNIANFRAGLIQALQLDGHEVIALTPTDQGVSRLDDINVRHANISINSKGMAPLQDAQLIQSFRRMLKHEAPDVVLGYTIKPNIYGGLAARSLGIPFLPNVSGLGTAFLSSGWLERLVTQLYRTSFDPLPHVIFQNGDDRDLFLERRIVRETQTVLVPGSGIDLDHFQPAPLPGHSGDGVTFLLIARLLRDKGVEEYVAAARHVRARYSNARIQLLGPTGAANRTAIDQASVKGWVAEGIVEYLGETDDVRPFIEAADCVVLPSYREGTPRTLLEAAAMGRPLIATDVPGCREVVDHEETGFLCRVKDADDLASTMIRMIEVGPEARAALGHAGRAKMERQFDQCIVIDIYRELIDRIATGADVSSARVPTL